MSTIVVIIAVIFFAFRALLGRRHFLDRTRQLVSALPQNHLEPYEAFAACPVPDPDAYRQAVRESRGLVGVWKILTVYVRIIQAHRKDGRITKKQARSIYSRALVQTYFTIKGLIEAPMCYFFPSLTPVSGMEAVRIYREIVLATHTLCAVEGAPEYIQKMSDLL